MSPDEREVAVPMTTARVSGRKVVILVGVVGSLLVLDILTKNWITGSVPLHGRVRVLGDLLRLTYTHNPGAAFGMQVGDSSRIFFLVLALVALVVLGWLYRATPGSDLLRLVAIALVAGGALGNVIDRLRFPAGVVDFIDVGIGSHRFWTFNVADAGVSVGACLLLLSFLLEERAERRAAADPGG